MGNLLKKCVKCKQLKPRCCFSKDGSKYSRDGLQNRCKECWKKFHPQSKARNRRLIAKYGGSKFETITNRYDQDDIGEEWNCQICGEKQVRGLNPYMFEYPEHEFIKICAKCEFEVVAHKIEDFFKLKEVI